MTPLSTHSEQVRGMDFSEPGWWALVVAGIGGFFGWRVATAKDAVRIETLQADNAAIKDRLRSLENGSIATATSLATLTAQMDSIGHTLSRLETKLDEKADK